MMTESKQRVIFLDIDGTLMGNEKKALFHNLDVIRKVRSLGHKVFVNTGRSTAFLPSHMDFKKDFDGVVSGAGARITFGDKEIFCKLIETEAVRKFCKLCITHDNVSVLEGVDKMIYMGNDNEGHDDWIRLTSDNFDELINDDLRIEKFTVLGVADPQIPELLGEEYMVIQHNGYAEIIKKAYSKSKAIEVVMDFLKLPVEQSVAMGDSLNDLDMIEYAGIGVAMGNAVPEIKEIADMVTQSVDEAGVAVALEKIFELV